MKTISCYPSVLETCSILARWVAVAMPDPQDWIHPGDTLVSTSCIQSGCRVVAVEGPTRSVSGQDMWSIAATREDGWPERVRAVRHIGKGLLATADGNLLFGLAQDGRPRAEMEPSLQDTCWIVRRLHDATALRVLGQMEGVVWCDDGNLHQRDQVVGSYAETDAGRAAAAQSAAQALVLGDRADEIHTTTANWNAWHAAVLERYLRCVAWRLRTLTEAKDWPALSKERRRLDRYEHDATKTPRSVFDFLCQIRYEQEDILLEDLGPVKIWLGERGEVSAKGPEKSETFYDLEQWESKRQAFLEKIAASRPAPTRTRRRKPEESETPDAEVEDEEGPEIVCVLETLPGLYSSLQIADGGAELHGAVSETGYRSVTSLPAEALDHPTAFLAEHCAQFLAETPPSRKEGKRNSFSALSHLEPQLSALRGKLLTLMESLPPNERNGYGVVAAAHAALDEMQAVDLLNLTEEAFHDRQPATRRQRIVAAAKRFAAIHAPTSAAAGPRYRALRLLIRAARQCEIRGQHQGCDYTLRLVARGKFEWDEVADEKHHTVPLRFSPRAPEALLLIERDGTVESHRLLTQKVIPDQARSFWPGGGSDDDDDLDAASVTRTPEPVQLSLAI